MTQFNNSYYKQLKNCYSSNAITPFDNPALLHINTDLAKQMGIPCEGDNQWLDWIYNNAAHQPLAQKYAGHQFGSFNPELGDGRGLLLGEWEAKGQKWDLHLKGAGQTPYSRMGDGRAVLRSTIREYVASEALHALGIPTSRALCLIGSDETVYREKPETGAMLIRTCESHIRFGTLEWFFHSKQSTELGQLFDYLFEHHFADWRDDENRYLKLFNAVVKSTAELIAKWQVYGFAHGVMNTDNMSILGITFDYGPYGFLDDYDPSYICNHSDHQGRYSFENQPSIGLWNLNMLAHAFTPYLSIEQIRDALQAYEGMLVAHYQQLMAKRLGIENWQQADNELLSGLLSLLHKERRDYHIPFRLLSELQGDGQAFIDFFIDRDMAQGWLNKYRQKIAAQKVTDEARLAKMQSVNPAYVLRNYYLQQAIEGAEQGDLTQLNRLFECLQRPFDKQSHFSEFAMAPPDSGKHLEISCSS